MTTSGFKLANINLPIWAASREGQNRDAPRVGRFEKARNCLSLILNRAMARMEGRFKEAAAIHMSPPQFI